MTNRLRRLFFWKGASKSDQLRRNVIDVGRKEGLEPVCSNPENHQHRWRWDGRWVESPRCFPRAWSV